MNSLSKLNTVNILTALFLNGCGVALLMALGKVDVLLTANWMMPYIPGQARFDSVWALTLMVVALGAWIGFTYLNGLKGIVLAVILATSALAVSQVTMYAMDNSRSSGDVDKFYQTEIERVSLLQLNNWQDPELRLNTALDILFMPETEVHEQWIALGFGRQLDALDDFSRQGLVQLQIRDSWWNGAVEAKETIDTTDFLRMGVVDREAYLFGILALSEDVRFIIRSAVFGMIVLILGLAAVLLTLAKRNNSLALIGLIPALVVLPLGEFLYNQAPQVVIPLLKTFGAL